MKSFVIKIVVFSFALIIFNWLYLVLLVKFHAGSAKAYDLSVMKNYDYQVIALGNSMVLDGFDAKVISEAGMSSYNLAMGGAHVKTSYLTLNKYLENNKKPKVVLIGLSSAAGRSYLNQVSYESPEFEYFIRYSLVQKALNPPLYHFQWALLEIIKIFVSKDHRNSRLELGQWKSSKVIEDYTNYTYQDFMNLIPQNSYLDSISQLCSKNQIDLVFVDFPGSKKNRNALPPQYKILLNGNDSFLVHNFNNLSVGNEIVDSKIDWLSENHFNKIGAEKFTKSLIPIIKTKIANQINE